MQRTQKPKIGPTGFGTPSVRVTNLLQENCLLRNRSSQLLDLLRGDEKLLRSRKGRGQELTLPSLARVDAEHLIIFAASESNNAHSRQQ